MPRTRLLATSLTLVVAFALGACSDGGDTDVGDDVAQPDPASQDDDGGLVMEPEDVGDDPPPVDGGGDEPLPPPPGTDPNGVPMSPEAAARVEEARRQWVALGVTSYEMVIERICFCPTSGEMRVTVEDGVVTAAEFTDPTRTEEIMLEFAPTIDQLLENAASTAHAFEDVMVELTVEDGVPVRGRADAPMVADEEVDWTVREFTPQ